MEITQKAADSSEEIRKKRIQVLKSILNVYRSRALSQNSACHSLMTDVVVPDHMKNYEFLRQQIRALHNDITLLMSFRESVNLIHNSFSCLGVSNLNNAIIKSELQKTVTELSFFSQSIMQIYNNTLNEIENIKKKQNYSLALANYQKNLNLMKERQKQSSQTAEETRRLQKAEVLVNKINFVREMKHILVGKFAGNSEQYSSLQQFRSAYRKNLTVDDFNETWDVGLK